MGPRTFVRWALWVGAVAAGCSGSGKLAPPDAGGDVSSDACVADAPSDASKHDAATVPVIECNDGTTCPEPLTCDPRDLLCERPCDATHPCGDKSGLFCSQASPVSSTGECIGPDYRCLGTVTYPAPTSPSIDVNWAILDVSGSSYGPAPGLTIRACARTDRSCATPLSTTTSNVNGHAILTVPTGTRGFDGYYDITGTALTHLPLLETLLFQSTPTTTGGDAGTVTVSDSAQLQVDFGAIGTFDPARAQMVVVATACRGSPAYGAKLVVTPDDARTHIGYVGEIGADLTFTSFPLGYNALAYVLNAQAPMASVVTTYGGQTVGALDVVLRPSTVSVVFLAPTP